MTIEEAIEYYKRLEESQRRVQEKYPSSSGKEVAEHFAQLIEWLKELEEVSGRLEADREGEEGRG